MPDEPPEPYDLAGSAAPDAAQRPGAVVPAAPVPGPVRFRVDARLAAVKVVGAVVFLLLAVAFRDDPGRVVFAGIAAAVVAVYAVRDLVAPIRLAADTEGVTLVEGFARRRRLAWSEIERVRVDQRRRLGLRAELLEIDTGETLHLFSGYDLGVPVVSAAEALSALAPQGLTERPAPG
jgi:hypothetical protein